jgi:hypothetical protein
MNPIDLVDEWGWKCVAWEWFTDDVNDSKGGTIDGSWPEFELQGTGGLRICADFLKI